MDYTPLLNAIIANQTALINIHNNMTAQLPGLIALNAVLTAFVASIFGTILYSIFSWFDINRRH